MPDSAISARVENICLDETRSINKFRTYIYISYIFSKCNKFTSVSAVRWFSVRLIRLAAKRLFQINQIVSSSNDVVEHRVASLVENEANISCEWMDMVNQRGVMCDH